MSIEKLRKNKEFRLVYRRGASFSNKLLVLYVFKNRKNLDENKNPYNKVGISVSKKVGKSVVRSRVKRLIQENYRINFKNIALKEGYDFVFIARTAINDKDFYEIERSMRNLFFKAGVIKDEKVINKNS
ncbi:ribonuclease P protein component [Clostridium sp.]|uniref:ribonuclease P protein component n=1 Tax=Clostridium sp. TaxID=1506 RepID=UPI003993D0B0